MTTRVLARNFAIQRHGNQKYGERPYSFHLDSVASHLRNYGDIAETIGFLHDTVEDTDCSLEEIAKVFGPFVAKCVSILTDEHGENRKDRKAKTYAKMAEVKGEETLALVVKTADRLANVKACFDDNNTRLIEVYKNEHSDFCKAVYRKGLCEDLWDELNDLISQKT